MMIHETHNIETGREHYTSMHTTKTKQARAHIQNGSNTLTNKQAHGQNKQTERQRHKPDKPQITSKHTEQNSTNKHANTGTHKPVNKHTNKQPQDAHNCNSVHSQSHQNKHENFVTTNKTA